MLGSPSASPRVRFDCVMLLSDLLESAITADARAGERVACVSGCDTCDGACTPRTRACASLQFFIP